MFRYLSCLCIGILLGGCGLRLGLPGFVESKPAPPVAGTDGQVTFVNKSGLYLYMFHITTVSGGTAVCDDLAYAGTFSPEEQRSFPLPPSGQIEWYRFQLSQADKCSDSGNKYESHVARNQDGVGPLVVYVE